MATQPVHTKILNAASREVLRPLGLQQRGRSRFWYDDGKWYGIQVEFQPSGFEKGSYLNVGIRWFWYPTDHWSFDLGSREDGFIAFKDETQFRAAAMDFAQQAAERVHEYRAKVATLESAYDKLATYCSGLPRRPGQWADLHFCILAGLRGRIEEAKSHASNAVMPDSHVEWQLARNRYIEALLDVVDDTEALRRWVEAKIAESRALLKLKELPPPVLPER